MLAVAGVQLLIPFVALLLGTPALEEPPGVVVIVIMNSGFAAMFALSALLFWYAQRQRSSMNQRPGTMGIT